MKSILIIIDYFGEWPQWFPIFIETCKENPTVNWLFHTDCKFDQFEAENITFRAISRNDYAAMVSKKLKVNFVLIENYKLCDLKPMYGLLYEKEISGFDFYGYGDIDVIYGNIRKFYTASVLEHTVISTHKWCISGHLALFKNVSWVRNAFRKHKGWKEMLENPHNQRFDEDSFMKVFSYPADINPKYYFLYDLTHPFSIKYRRKLFFWEQFTTPLTPNFWKRGRLTHPEVWYWRNGTLTTESGGNHEYIYLHFMNYISGRWMDPIYSKHPTWKELGDFVFITPEQLHTKGLRVDRMGFHSID